MGLKVETRLIPVTFSYPQGVVVVPPPRDLSPEAMDGLAPVVDVVAVEETAPMPRDEFVYQVRDPWLNHYQRLTAFDVNRKIKMENRYDPDSTYPADKFGFYRRKLLA